MSTVDRNDLALALAKQVPQLTVLVLLVAAFLWTQDRNHARIAVALEKLAAAIVEIDPCYCEHAHEEATP